jgi:16S rRNA (adenine1518-N6/adenine1519-N6)-dimethyltransferase
VSPLAEGYPPPRQLLDRHGLHPKHSWGQNFLGDPGLLERIAAAAIPEPVPGAIEIGAGLGHLTARLLDRCERLVAIERDRELAPVLQAELGAQPGFELCEDNALTVDYPALAVRLGGRPPVVGNLPYQIVGPLLFVLLQATNRLGDWTFLVQREVAQRLSASPGGTVYGALTAHLGLQRRARALFPVHRAAFLPPPRVDSLLIRLEPLEQPLVAPGSDLAARVHRLIDAGFAQRRKTLANSLRAGGWDDAARRLSAAGIDPTRRAETLAPLDFVRLAEA